MTTPETHPAGTADLVIGLDLARGNDWNAVWEAHPAGTEARIEQLEAELTRANAAIDPAAIREAALWDLLEEIDAQIDLAEEISPEFADKVQLALLAGQTKGAAE
jgi:hypothetical protein